MLPNEGYMDLYNNKYARFIEPLYGSKRDIYTDNTLLYDNNAKLPHKYSIKERVDMTGYPTYSIDPEGCEDADDAFSIYTEQECLYLVIHIADPTEYIHINSPLWKDMETRIVTKYPSFTSPIHMMPDEIMARSSLMVNQYGDIKHAISVVTEIDTVSYKPIGNAKLLFTCIRVSKHTALNYAQASKTADLGIGLKISDALQRIRGEKTTGIVLNEVSNVEPKCDDNGDLYFYSDTTGEIQMKQMIAEFAIFANSFVGEYLKLNFNGNGIFRACSAKDWLNTVNTNISGQELLNGIIVNGITSEYVASMKPHDLVGSPEYCHFTSPIRRLSDCICHFLLKYIHLQTQNPNLPVPFTNQQLDLYSNKCLITSKAVRNIQFKDKKFRIIQTISSLLSREVPINIGFYISSYMSPFLNIIIRNVNDSSMYMSYTLRVSELQTDYVVRETYYLDITHVNCPGKFDEGSIPELDKLFCK